MTRFPTETRQIQGLEGPDYPSYNFPAPICANPDCENEATDRHHLFSRGLMGGAYDWVRLHDGSEVGNIVGLCFTCHKKITENKARIIYTGDKFHWAEGYSGEVHDLRYQPPKRSGEVEAVGEPAPSPDARKICPTCKRTIPRPRIKNPQEEKKPRKTWSVAVPYDIQEDGAEVIDQLLELAEEKMDKHGLNWSHGNRVVYYKLSAALALFVQHADDILSDM